MNFITTINYTGKIRQKETSVEEESHGYKILAMCITVVFIELFSAAANQVKVELRYNDVRRINVSMLPGYDSFKVTKGNEKEKANGTIKVEA